MFHRSWWLEDEELQDERQTFRRLRRRFPLGAAWSEGASQALRVLGWSALFAFCAYTGWAFKVDEWTPYYFSSMLQGYGALFAIVVSISVISFQVAAGKFEELADYLVKDSRLRLCSVTYGVVIVVSSCVLAWGYREGAFTVYKALAGLVLLAAIASFYLTVALARSLVLATSPRLFMGNLVRTQGLRENHESEQHPVTRLLLTLARRGVDEFEAGCQGYMHEVRERIASLSGRDRATAAAVLVFPVSELPYTRINLGECGRVLAGSVWALVCEHLAIDPPTAAEVYGQLHHGLPDEVQECVSEELTDLLDWLDAWRKYDAADSGPSLAVARFLAFLWAVDRETLMKTLTALPGSDDRIDALRRRLMPRESTSESLEQALTEFTDLSPGQLTQVIKRYRRLAPERGQPGRRWPRSGEGS